MVLWDASQVQSRAISENKPLELVSIYIFNMKERIEISEKLTKTDDQVWCTETTLHILRVPLEGSIWESKNINSYNWKTWGNYSFLLIKLFNGGFLFGGQAFYNFFVILNYSAEYVRYNNDVFQYY